METRTIRLLFGQNREISVRILLGGVVWFALALGIFGESIFSSLSITLGGSVIIVSTAMYAYLNDGVVICLMFAFVCASLIFIWKFFSNLDGGYPSLLQYSIGLLIQAVGVGVVLGVFGFVLGSGFRRLTNRASI